MVQNTTALQDAGLADCAHVIASMNVIREDHQSVFDTHGSVADCSQ